MAYDCVRAFRIVYAGAPCTVSVMVYGDWLNTGLLASLYKYPALWAFLMTTHQSTGWPVARCAMTAQAVKAEGMRSQKKTWWL